MPPFRFGRGGHDKALPGDDGTFDPPAKWVSLGVLVPLGLLVWAGRVIYRGGITLGGGRHGPPADFEGTWIVLSAVTAIVGVALILVARFALPNIFTTSYAYQYVAAGGIFLTAAGILTFLIAAMV